MALDQLNHIIDITFSSVEKFEPFDQYTMLQSLYTALDHQLQDGLMGQQEFVHTQFIVRKLWDLKLKIHMIENELSDAIGHHVVPGGYNYRIIVCLRVYAFVYETMLRLIAKGIIRSYNMQQRRIIAAIKPPNGIVSNCDVCGRLMFNAQHYMHMNDAYFSPSTIRFRNELKKIP